MSKSSKKSRWILMATLVFSLSSIGIYHSFFAERVISKRTPDAAHAFKVSAPLQAVQGTVSSSGNPIASSEVCIRGATAKNKLEKACVPSDNLGEYIVHLPAGDYIAIASADGFVSATHPVTIATQTIRLDFNLQAAPPTLAGYVNDGAGRAIAGARIAIYQGDASISNAITDQHGHFAAWAPSVSVTLAASAMGYQEARVHSFAPSADILIVMFNGFEVSGEVVKARIRHPIANVRVTASQSVAGVADTLDRSVITDDKGRFTFAGLPPGKVIFAVQSNHLSGRTIATIVSQARNEGVTVVVQDAQEVTGKFLVAPQGTPCRDGFLQLIPQESFDSDGKLDVAQAFALETTTDDAKPSPITAYVNEVGLVELPAVTSGRYNAFATCHEHQLVSGPRQLEVGATDIAAQEWRFEPGLGIEAHTVDENNHAIESIPLILKPIPTSTPTFAEARGNPAAYAIRTGQTDTRGVYRFGNIAPGKYEVIAQSNAVVAFPQATQKVEVQLGMGDSKVTLTLPVLGAIEIRAHTSDNQPLSRMMFYASDSSGKRFEARYVGDGCYTLAPLPRGQYQVMAYDNKNPKQVVPGASGEWVRVDDTKPIKLDFQYEVPQASITGVVRDSSGLPVIAAVQAVSVTLDDQDERYASLQIERNGEQYRTTDEQGRFELNGLRPDASYRLFVESRGGQKIEQKNVLPGQFVQLSLPALASVSGNVITASGAPANDFIIVIENTKLGDRQTRTFKKADGTFKLESVNPGPIEINVLTNDSHLQGATTINLAPGESRSGVQLQVNAHADDSE